MSAKPISKQKNLLDELIQQVVREIAERQDFLRHLQAAKGTEFATETERQGDACPESAARGGRGGVRANEGGEPMSALQRVGLSREQVARLVETRTIPPPPSPVRPGNVARRVTYPKHPDLAGLPLRERKRITAQRWRRAHPGQSSGQKRG